MGTIAQMEPATQRGTAARGQMGPLNRGEPLHGGGGSCTDGRAEQVGTVEQMETVEPDMDS